MSELINIKSFVGVVVTGKKIMNKNALNGSGIAINEKYSPLSMAKFLYPEYLPELHPEEVFKTWLEKYQQLHYIKGHAYPELY